MSSTYTYRVLKSSWGVRVDLRAAARTGTPPPGAVCVADGLLVLDATRGAVLTPEQLSMLGRGLGLVATEIVGAVPQPPVTVVVLEVEHNQIDYQDEGVAAAVLGWAIREYGLAPREIPVSYHSSVRRYVFDFDAVHRPG